MAIRFHQSIQKAARTRLRGDEGRVGRTPGKAVSKKTIGKQVDLHAELRSAPYPLLNKIAPAQDLDEPTEALDSALSAFEAEEPEEPVRIVVSPPGSGVG